MGGSEKTVASFFDQAQTHMAKSALHALAATNTHSQNAMATDCGTDHQGQPESTDLENWSAQMEVPCATTGNSPEVASPPPILRNTNAPAAEGHPMELSRALEQRRCEPISPYRHHTWSNELSCLDLLPRYPTLVRDLQCGFDLGIPPIRSTYTPPNHPSLVHLPNVYKSIIDNEFAAGCYIGPFTRAQLEDELGPFQTSPLSLIPKTSKPRKYRAVHSFSFPHNPSRHITSINSHIDSENFLCTWGTFDIVALLIACLPPRSQASVWDVAEAYRTIPANPSQWPGLVICLQMDDQYAVNTCNNFGLTSAGGLYGTVANAGADIFQGNRIGPLSKWVDDHIFFQIPCDCLMDYNANCAQWSSEIIL